MIPMSQDLLTILVATVALVLGGRTQESATINAPSSATGGSQVVVTGTSPDGKAGTAVYVDDDEGSLDYEIEWDGNRYTITFTMPNYDPKSGNEVDIGVIPRDVAGEANAAILVT